MIAKMYRRLVGEIPMAVSYRGETDLGRILEAMIRVIDKQSKWIKVKSVKEGEEGSSRQHSLLWQQSMGIGSSWLKDSKVGTASSGPTRPSRHLSTSLSSEQSEETSFATEAFGGSTASELLCNACDLVATHRHDFCLLNVSLPATSATNRLLAARRLYASALPPNAATGGLRLFSPPPRASPIDLIFERLAGEECECPPAKLCCPNCGRPRRPLGRPVVTKFPASLLLYIQTPTEQSLSLNIDETIDLGVLAATSQAEPQGLTAGPALAASAPLLRQVNKESKDFSNSLPVGGVEPTQLITSGGPGPSRYVLTGLVRMEPRPDGPSRLVSYMKVEEEWIAIKGSEQRRASFGEVTGGSGQLVLLIYSRLIPTTAIRTNLGVLAKLRPQMPESRVVTYPGDFITGYLFAGREGGCSLEGLLCRHGRLRPDFADSQRLHRPTKRGAVKGSTREEGLEFNKELAEYLVSGHPPRHSVLRYLVFGQSVTVAAAEYIDSQFKSDSRLKERAYLAECPACLTQAGLETSARAIEKALVFSLLSRNEPTPSLITREWIKELSQFLMLDSALFEGKTVRGLHPLTLSAGVGRMNTSARSVLIDERRRGRGDASIVSGEFISVSDDFFRLMAALHGTECELNFDGREVAVIRVVGGEPPQRLDPAQKMLFEILRNWSTRAEELGEEEYLILLEINRKMNLLITQGLGSQFKILNHFNIEDSASLQRKVGKEVQSVFQTKDPWAVKFDPCAELASLFQSKRLSVESRPSVQPRFSDEIKFSRFNSLCEGAEESFMQSQLCDPLVRSINSASGVSCQLASPVPTSIERESPGPSFATSIIAPFREEDPIRSSRPLFNFPIFSAVRASEIIKSLIPRNSAPLESLELSGLQPINFNTSIYGDLALEDSLRLQQSVKIRGTIGPDQFFKDSKEISSDWIDKLQTQYSETLNEQPRGTIVGGRNSEKIQSQAKELKVKNSQIRDSQVNSSPTRSSRVQFSTTRDSQVPKIPARDSRARNSHPLKSSLRNSAVTTLTKTTEEKKSSDHLITDNDLNLLLHSNERSQQLSPTKTDQQTTKQLAKSEEEISDLNLKDKNEHISEEEDEDDLSLSVLQNQLPKKSKFFNMSIQKGANANFSSSQISESIIEENLPTIPDLPSVKGSQDELSSEFQPLPRRNSKQGRTSQAASSLSKFANIEASEGSPSKDSNEVEEEKLRSPRKENSQDFYLSIKKVSKEDVKTPERKTKVMSEKISISSEPKHRNSKSIDEGNAKLPKSKQSTPKRIDPDRSGAKSVDSQHSSSKRPTKVCRESLELSLQSPRKTTPKMSIKTPGDKENLSLTTPRAESKSRAGVASSPSSKDDKKKILIRWK